MSAPNTGIKSSSFALWLATFLPGLAALAVSFYTNGATHSAVTGLVGGTLALGSTVAKLFHDRGIHVATIENAASVVAAELPALKADVATLKDAATAAKV